MLQMGGQIQLADGAVAVEATGEANLGILQGFFRNLRSRGTAALLAAMKGPITKPSFSGSARLVDGRIRHLSRRTASKPSTAPSPSTAAASASRTSRRAWPAAR